MKKIQGKIYLRRKKCNIDFLKKKFDIFIKICFTERANVREENCHVISTFWLTTIDKILQRKELNLKRTWNFLFLMIIILLMMVLVSEMSRRSKNNRTSFLINEISKLEICVAINEINIRIISLNYSWIMLDRKMSNDFNYCLSEQSPSL